ncbi:recombinase family protein [Photobacterium phosphoreum]|uniref:recombinase family protein n=1 Tax=Photobacterium phosphoreum TaxID=659 RepID=UPI0015E76BE6|nr:recombinase family protein [Photobacterium phosphoreum]
MNKLFSYQRFSTSTQLGGDSLRRQTEAARTYAEQHDLDYQDKTFSDLGVSGYKAKKRSGLEALLEAVKNGSIAGGDVIFLENLDRITRKGFQDTNELIKQIVSTGVVLHVQSDNLTLDKSSLNDFTSIMRVALMADLAWKESEKKSQRLLETKGQKRLRAIEHNEAQARKLPFWIDYNKATSKYQFNELVEIVRRIVSERLSGKSDRTIINGLNNDGIMTPRGSRWYENSIRNIYTHKAVYGAYQTMRTVRDDPTDHTTAKTVLDKLVLDHYPAIMSPEDFESIQPIAGVRSGNHGSHNHLRRITRCMRCGEPIGKKLSKHSNSNGNAYVQWFCMGIKNTGKLKCDQPTFKDLDQILFRITKHLKRVRSSSIDAEQKVIQQSIAQKEMALSEIQQAILGGVGITALIATSIELEKEIDNLRSEITIDYGDKDYDLLSESVGDAVAWNILAVKLIKSINVDYITNPKRIGMGKDHGSYRVVINQSNGYTISAVVSGVDKIDYKDLNIIMSDTHDIASISPNLHEWELDQG